MLLINPGHLSKSPVSFPINLIVKLAKIMVRLENSTHVAAE